MYWMTTLSVPSPLSVTWWVPPWYEPTWVAYSPVATLVQTSVKLARSKS